MTHITLKGDVPSKKNSLRRIMRGGKIFTVPSAAHEKWYATQRALLGIRKPQPGSYAVTLTMFPATKRRGDLSNKAESVMDLLVAAGYLSDDNWFVVSHLDLYFGGCDKENPRVEVGIARLDNLVKQV